MRKKHGDDGNDGRGGGTGGSGGEEGRTMTIRQGMETNAVARVCALALSSLLFR